MGRSGKGERAKILFTKSLGISIRPLDWVTGGLVGEEFLHMGSGAFVRPHAMKSYAM